LYCQSHFTRDQKIRLGAHGIPACAQRRNQFRFGHRRRLGEILRWAVKIQRMDIKPRTNSLSQLVDRCTTRLKVQHHLRRHFGRKRAHTLRAHTVITRKNYDLSRIN